MKYIDTEKIRAEIERRLKYTHDWLRGDEKRHPKQTSVSKNYYKMKGDERTLDALLNFLDSLQQEQSMPDSTKLIELWHEDKEKLKEKDFRNDPWRLAYNAFLCGFGRGIAVNKQELPEVECEDLEEAAEEYAYTNWEDNDYHEGASEGLPFDAIGHTEKCFKAGAEWQKEQMVRDGLEGEVCGRVKDHINVRFPDGLCKYLKPENISHIPADVKKYEVGDKVRVIIVKEEEE